MQRLTLISSTLMSLMTLADLFRSIFEIARSPPMNCFGNILDRQQILAEACSVFLSEPS
jgi:hypothetical protein